MRISSKQSNLTEKLKRRIYSRYLPTPGASNNLAIYTKYAKESNLHYGQKAKENEENKG